MQSKGKIRLAAACMVLAASGCTVVPIAEDQARRAQRSGAFDAAAYVAKAWDKGIAEQFEQSAIDYKLIAPDLAGNLDRAGKAHGRQSTDGSPWTFVVSGEATVSAVNRASRAGSILLSPTGKGEALKLETGPIVLSSALRDALAMFDFNDFADQLSFAAVNKALNDKALAKNAATLSALKQGDRVRFLGALSIDPVTRSRKMLPIQIERIGG